jgi:hypothetical protein
VTISRHISMFVMESQRQVIIETISILNGNLPPRVFGLVAEWALAHRDELRENWNLIQADIPPKKINPLE